MTGKPLTVTEKTLIPFSLVGGIVGGTVWLTTMYVELRSHADLIHEIRQHQESASQVLEKIDERLSKIEGKIGVNPSPS